MPTKIWLCLVLTGCLFTACSGEPGKQQLETARFEEKQHNREHAIKLYEEIVSKYPNSPNAGIARQRLEQLQGGT